MKLTRLIDAPPKLSSVFGKYFGRRLPNASYKEYENCHIYERVRVTHDEYAELKLRNLVSEDSEVPLHADFGDKSIKKAIKIKDGMGAFDRQGKGSRFKDLVDKNVPDISFFNEFDIYFDAEGIDE